MSWTVGQWLGAIAQIRKCEVTSCYFEVQLQLGSGTPTGRGGLGRAVSMLAV